MRVKVKNIPFGYLAVKPGKIYDAFESSGEYIINIDGRDYGIPRDYCEVYKPFAMAKEIKNPDGTYTYQNPTAYFIKKEIQSCDLNTNKIFILQPGLKSQTLTRSEVVFISPLVEHSPVIFPLKVCENNPDWFEPIYDEEKPFSDVKKINVELRIEKIKKELETLLGDIKQWKQ